MLVLLGAAAGLVSGLLEAVWLIAAAFGYFDGPRELIELVLLLAALGGGLGALVGLVESGLWRLIGRLRQRAVVITLLFAPPVAWVCAQIFAGPQARKLPAHAWMALAIGLLGLALIFFGQRWLQRIPLWLAALATVICYAADQKLLVRLYPFFHQALAVGVFAGAQLTIVRSGRRISRRWALPALIGFVAAGALALVGLGREHGLRTLVLERTVLAAPLVRLAPTPEHAPRPVAVEEAEPLLPPGPRLADVDVFLVTIDAFRADRLNARTAPHLTELAEHGVRFDRAYAQVPHTSFSVATLLTGKHVYSLSELGLEAAGHQTLAGVLKRERYKTAAFYPPSVFYIDHDRLKSLEDSAYGFEYVKYEYLAAPQRTEQIFHFLETEKPRRVFVWVHYLEPHEPYDAHPGHTLGDGTEARYDGEIHFVDAEVQRLVDYLKIHRPHSLLVVAADHGEEFGEHGGHYHGTTLYEEQVRVPLFFTALDEGMLPARRVAGPVGLVDVAPTLLPLLGIAPSAKMRGRDLGPYMLPGQSPIGPEYAEIGRQKMIVLGDDKLICDLQSDACRLFDLAHDPAEQHNLADQDRDKADRLRARLEAWLRAETRFEHREDIDAPTRRILERGRLGERAAASELARLLQSPSENVRREAERLLVRLPPDPATRPFLAGDDPWMRILRARLGEPEMLPRCADSDELCPEVALLTRDPLDLARALEVVGEDRELELRLLDTLGRTHDPRALDPLLLHLAQVRTRVETVRALEELGDARAVAGLARWIGGDPYIPVRAEMASALGRLSARDADARATARSALVALLAVERDPEVMRAASDALQLISRKQ